MLGIIDTALEPHPVSRHIGGGGSGYADILVSAYETEDFHSLLNPMLRHFYIMVNICNYIVE